MEELEDTNFIGYRIKIYPTKDQETIFKSYFGTSRFVYNLCLSIQKDHYKRYLQGEEKSSFISFIDMNNKISDLKRTNDEYKWLSNFDSKSITYVIKDLSKAYKYYFKNSKHYRLPKYKKKKYSDQMFPIRADRLQISNTEVRIPSIGYVYCGNHGYDNIIGSGNAKIQSFPYKHYYNARVIYDGYSYWLAFSLERSHKEGIEPNSCKKFKNNDLWQHKSSSDPIGIDLNAHKDSWIVLSNGKIYQRPNCYKEDKQIAKYYRKLMHKIKINKEKKTNSTIANTKLKEPDRTKNEEKILKKLNKAYKRKTNKKLAVIHKCACDILTEKPKFVVMESLNINNMMIPRFSNTNKKFRTRFNKKISESIMNTAQSIIGKKIINNGIPVYKADNEFPSSQLCSNCGYRQKIGSNRIYKCPCCGNIIDRDLNAAINLSNYFTYNEFACNKALIV